MYKMLMWNLFMRLFSLVSFLSSCSPNEVSRVRVNMWWCVTDLFLFMFDTIKRIIIMINCITFPDKFDFLYVLWLSGLLQATNSSRHDDLNNILHAIGFSQAIGPYICSFPNNIILQARLHWTATELCPDYYRFSRLRHNFKECELMT